MAQLRSEEVGKVAARIKALLDGNPGPGVAVQLVRDLKYEAGTLVAVDAGAARIAAAIASRAADYYGQQSFKLDDARARSLWQDMRHAQLLRLFDRVDELARKSG
jgi:hypothetical protein